MYWLIQSRQRKWWRVDLFRNPQGMLRFIPKWKTSQWPAPETHFQAWLILVRYHHWIVVPSMAPHHLCVTRWWFWGGIRWRTPRSSPSNGIQRKIYITMDWESKKYSGIDIKWGYAPVHKNRKARLSMEDYIEDCSLKWDTPNQSRPGYHLTSTPPFFMG